MEIPLSELSPTSAKVEPKSSPIPSNASIENQNGTQSGLPEQMAPSYKLELERTPELFQQAILGPEDATSKPQAMEVDNELLMRLSADEVKILEKTDLTTAAPKSTRIIVNAGFNGSDHISQFKSDLKLRGEEKITEQSLDEEVPQGNFDYVTICIEYDQNFTKNLKSLGELFKKDFVKDAKKVTYHIDFDSTKKWASISGDEKEQYVEFIEDLSQAAAAKVTHCSLIHKYDPDTVFVTEKDQLAELGQEILGDINKWTNLKIFDYGLNCLRFFPGVRFPDSLEVMHVGGGNSLETLAGFKIPSSLKVLDASRSLLSTIDYISLPPTTEHLLLSDNRIYFLNYAEFPVRLQSLDLSNNRIDLLKNINFPKHLRYLSVSNNPIECIKGVRFPESIEHLDLSCIPNESMTGIKFPDLTISLNLQQSMTNTRGLKIPPLVRDLNMSGNGVNSINPLKLPNSIESLFLTNNNIKTLNKVAFPSCLKELYLGNNMITTLKNVQFPPTLEILDLEMDPHLEENEKFITSIKDVIFSAHLKVLNLGYHLIKTIESMDFPYSLEELKLQYNDLRVFRNVRFGPNLRILDLSGNQDLYNMDGVVLPNSLKEFRVPSVLLNNLPYGLVERVNKGEVKLTKSMPYTI